MAKQKIPGPKGWPLIGNVGQVNMQKLHVTMDNLRKKYGGVCQFSLFSTRIIVISDINIMERAFALCELCYRPNTSVKQLKYDGSGFLESNFSDKELALKSVLWKAISAIENDALIKGLTDRQLYHFLESLEKNEDIPLEDLMKIAAKMYSTEIMGIEAEDKHAEVVVEYLDAVNLLYRGGKTIKLTKMPWLRYVPGSVRSAVRGFLAARDQLVATLVTDARANQQQARGHGILQYMLEVQSSGNEKSTITDENLNACTLDLIFNSVFPTAKNVAYILLQAIEYPDMQSKIHEELDGISTRKTITEIEEEDVPYTMAVILECMRYLSLVNTSFQHYVNEDTEVDGYRFPKGSIILGNHFGIHHDEALWDAPWTLRPERFLDATGQILPTTDPVRKRILHFGLGKRKCRGTSIAMEKIFRLVLGIFTKYRVLAPVNSDLPSSDPRDYPTVAIITPPQFTVRFEKK